MKLAPILALSPILLIVCLITSQPCYAQSFALGSYQAKYTVYYDGIPIGRSTTQLEIQAKNRYLLCITNITTMPFLRGQIKECSAGTILHNTVQPATYQYFYQKNDQQKLLRITFDRKKRQAIMHTENSTWRMPVTSNTQDKISYQIALRLGVANNQTQFSFPVADGGKLKTYRFTVVGKERITTPMQTFDTFKLIRLPIPGKENVSLWMAPEINNIVVRVEQSKRLVDIGTAEITSLQETSHAKI